MKPPSAHSALASRRNGLDTVVDLDSIATIPRELLVRPIGVLLEDQEHDLTRAFHEAFDLQD